MTCNQEIMHLGDASFRAEVLNLGSRNQGSISSKTIFPWTAEVGVKGNGSKWYASYREQQKKLWSLALMLISCCVAQERELGTPDIRFCPVWMRDPNQVLLTSSCTAKLRGADSWIPIFHTKKGHFTWLVYRRQLTSKLSLKQQTERKDIHSR